MKNEKVSLSAFHSSVLERGVIKTPSQLLLLLADKVTEPSTVCDDRPEEHYRELESWAESGNHLRPICMHSVSRSSGLTQNIVLFMGPMHIEQAFMDAIGD